MHNEYQANQALANRAEETARWAKALGVKRAPAVRTKRLGFFASIFAAFN